MNEQDLVDRLLPHLAVAGGDLVIGPGQDDSAAWRQPAAGFIVASIDMAVEGIHFDISRQRPQDVGWRALCFALGDLAAKGATPTYGLVALAVPRRWKPEVPPGIYEGLSALAGEVGLKLVGGDTSLAPEHGSLTLAVLGHADIEPRPRSAVKPGWAVGVTGPLGGAGLNRRRPRPRLRQGRDLAAQGLVCGDISDGLIREHDKLLRMSGVGARLRMDLVPLAPGASATAALASGEEVELVCWGPSPLPAGLTMVGELAAGAVVVVDPAGRELEIQERGYDHFA